MSVDFRTGILMNDHDRNMWLAMKEKRSTVHDIDCLFKNCFPLSLFSKLDFNDLLDEVALIERMSEW